MQQSVAGIQCLIWNVITVQGGWEAADGVHVEDVEMKVESVFKPRWETRGAQEIRCHGRLRQEGVSQVRR